MPDYDNPESALDYLHKHCSERQIERAAWEVEREAMQARIVELEAARARDRHIEENITLDPSPLTLPTLTNS